MNFSDLLSSIKKGNGASKSHMKNLIEMAAADGNFMDEEFDLLKSIAKEHGISESHLNDIRKKPGDIKFEVPKNSDEKFRQLYDLVNMMSIDNEVHFKEAELCTLFAVNFGYPRQHVKELIDIIRANIKNGQSVQETRKRVSMIIG
jgi:uncharacterized tellurite resistance protein B-like protein